MARGMLLLLALLCAAMPYDGAAQPQGQTCLQASGGAQDVCHATSQSLCCTLPSGQVATYTERVYPAPNRSEAPKGSAFCVDPANFFTCVATRCVDKGQKCA